MNKKLVLATLFFLSVFAISAQEARYEVKSAIIKKTTEMMGLKSETVQYIDDYGAKEAIITDGSHTIIKENMRINISSESKTGVKRALPKNRINFMKLTPEMIEENELKEESREEFAGKICIKYTMAMNVMGRKVTSTVWVWKGVPIKTIVSEIGYTELVTEIQENVAINAEVFLVPDDVTIQ